MRYRESKMVENKSEDNTTTGGTTADISRLYDIADENLVKSID